MAQKRSFVGYLLGAVVLISLVGCALLQPPQALHPPGWIHGEWGDGSLDASYTFTATTMIQRIQTVSLDFGELYLATDIPVTETITDTLYSYTVPTEGGFMTMEFAKVDGNTINMAMRTNISTIGPVPLYRQ